MTRAEEARLLYQLFIAAEEEGRLLNLSLAERWQELKESFESDQSERSLDALSLLFHELERTDTLAGTWIYFRWSAAMGKRTQHLATRKRARRRV